MIKELADFLDLEGFSEFYMSEITFNLIPYNKVIYNNDFGYCIQYKKPSNHLTPIDKMSEEDQLKLLNHLKTPTLKNCLLQLNRAGWSLLIDSRWEDDVKTLLKESFPNISDELIQEVLNIVIV
jgi:hypothetical protein